MPSTPTGPFEGIPIAYVVHDLQRMTDEERSAIVGYLHVSDYVNTVLRGIGPADPQTTRASWRSSLWNGNYCRWTRRPSSSLT